MITTKPALYFPILLLSLITLCGIFLLRDYVVPSFQLILGLMIAPFVFRIKEKANYSGRCLYPVLIFSGLYFFLTTPLFLYLALGCLLFYVIESFYGKIGILPFIFLVCFSPALYYFVNVFTFSLRLGLSDYVSNCLHAVGYAVRSCGNYFIFSDGCKFNVDKTCLGLNMFNTGLALTTLLIGLNEKRSGKSLPINFLLLVFILAIVFLVAANFIRILVIVLFKAMPNTSAHEVIGMFALILCMVVPIHVLIYYGAKKFGKAESENKNAPEIRYKSTAILTIAMLAVMLGSFFKLEKESIIKVYDSKLEALELPGFSKTKNEDGVVEFRNAYVLLYIKPAVHLLESDHPPSMCWKGSGYDVDEITEVTIANRKILTAIIRKDSVTHYTAWWYDNGSIQTTDQWKVRLSGGEPFRMINLTATNREDLDIYCLNFLKTKLF